MPSTTPESAVFRAWQQCLGKRTGMLTESGEPVRVIYPGRLNRERGADLLDAVLATGQGTKKGDIEIHFKSSNWEAHHHHRDPAYNRVILHVVMQRDTEITTRLENGERVPILCLERYRAGLASPKDPVLSPGEAGLPCQQTLRFRPAGVITGFLESAGRERFLNRAEAIDGNLSEIEAGQVLYREIMTALGYARNKLPFRELADRVPLRSLEALMGEDGEENGLVRQQARLIGTAGLLPSQRAGYPRGDRMPPDGWVEKLEQAWKSLPPAAVMKDSDWQFSPIRPGNSPLRRLAAMSYLVQRFQPKGMLHSVDEKLAEAKPEQSCRELESLFLVVTGDYWARHFDFGRLTGKAAPALLGGGRAADITVNAVLPFAFARGKRHRTETARKALDIYLGYPRLAENKLERHMKVQLGLSNRQVASTTRQQGLLHLYKTMCSQGKCRSCPLGKSGYLH